MSGKWTPGPWKVALTNPRRVLSSDDIIAEIEDELRGPDAAGQMAANARLISASPQMFDALKDLVEETADMLTWGCEPDVIRNARAALAKAKGEGA